MKEQNTRGFCVPPSLVAEFVVRPTPSACNVTSVVAEPSRAKTDNLTCHKEALNVSVSCNPEPVTWQTTKLILVISINEYLPFFFQAPQATEPQVRRVRSLRLGALPAADGRMRVRLTTSSIAEIPMPIRYASILGIFKSSGATLQYKH